MTDDQKLDAALATAMETVGPLDSVHHAEGATMSAFEVAERAREGRKNDLDKVRMDLVPPELLEAVATVLTFGAKKYEPRNWEHGMDWSRVYGAALRHMNAWWGGRQPTHSFPFTVYDDETHLSHLWHAAACIAFLIAYEERGVGNDDRPSRP